MTEPYLQIHEHQEGRRLRLQLRGELDIASEPALRKRLEQLRAEKRFVRLDLSELEFMDSTGILLLLSALKHAREDGWQFEVDPDLSPQVQHLFKLTNVERFIWEATTEHQMSMASPAAERRSAKRQGTAPPLP